MSAASAPGPCLRWFAAAMPGVGAAGESGASLAAPTAMTVTDALPRMAGC